MNRCTIPVAAVATGVPAGTIRRWIAEHKLAQYGWHKPHLVDVTAVERLRDTLHGRPSRQ